MILSQVYTHLTATPSSGNISKWTVYPDMDSIPEPNPDNPSEYTVPPLSIEMYCGETWGGLPDELAEDFGWKKGGSIKYKEAPRIPARRFCELKEFENPKPTIRYYMAGKWLTGREVLKELKH